MQSAGQVSLADPSATHAVRSGSWWVLCQRRGVREGTDSRCTTTAAVRGTRLWA